MTPVTGFVDELRALLADGALPLPSLPEIAVRINEAINDERKHIAHVASLVQMDAALAARILKVANSVLYNNGRPVEDCRQAIIRLGLQTTRHLVSCLVMHNVFEIRHPQLRERVRQLWQHSCHVAAIAHVLAGLSTGLRPEKALLAGLLHDVGVLSILKFAQDRPELLNNPARLDALIAELRGELGASVLRAWSLDEDLCEAARCAEHWTRDHGGPLDYTDVTIVAQVHSYLGTSSKRDIPPLTGVPAFAKFPLSQLGPDAGVEMLSQARNEIRTVLQMLNQ